MLIAERNGIRRSSSRSKRRRRSTGLPATFSTRDCGTGMPDFCARDSATASQTTVLISSSSRGNFAMARWPSFPDGSLGPCAAKRGAGREQQSQFLLGVFLFHHMFGRGEQFRELDQRGDALDALLPQEGPAFFFRKAQCALTGLVVYQQQEVDFLERTRRPALALRAPAFHAAHERTPPTVGRGVTDGAEHGRIWRSVKRARSKLQGWLQRESRGIFQPCLVVFEGGAFLVLAYGRTDDPSGAGRR